MLLKIELSSAQKGPFGIGELAPAFVFQTERHRIVVSWVPMRRRWWGPLRFSSDAREPFVPRCGHPNTLGSGNCKHHVVGGCDLLKIPVGPEFGCVLWEMNPTCVVCKQPIWGGDEVVWRGAAHARCVTKQDD
jgi:hypothetical protein